MRDKKTIGNLKTAVRYDSDFTETQSLPDGTLLGQYKILRMLGKGGMGEVYEAEHIILGLKYALKVLPHVFSYKSNAVDMFKSEARVMATLKHENIVFVDEFGNHDGRYWLRMEFVPRIRHNIATLADFAQYTGNTIEQSILADLLKQILEGLSFAHKHGAIHCDLKPSNILLQTRPGGGVLAKIADFGLVKLVGEEWVRTQAEVTIRKSMGEQDEQIPHVSCLTVSNALVGTFEYMSPEQRDGLEITAQSDLYAVGLIAYRLLTAKKLGLKLPSEIDETLHPLWDNFVQKALEEDLDGRYKTADNMLEDLYKIIRDIKPPDMELYERNQKKNGQESTTHVNVSDNDSSWTVPDLGMQFIWIRKLHCWGGVFQVTNGEYRKFKPEHNSKEYEGHSLNEERQPVVYVNFEDALEYAEWLTHREENAGRLPSGYRYRLPTKDEWTTFCQCGEELTYPWGNNWPPKSGHAGNYADATAKMSFSKMATIADYDDGFAVTCSVEMSWPNQWGLYGVGGNVWECTIKSTKDLSFDAWRGASWFNANESELHSTYRSTYGASFRSSSYGFRLVLAK